MAFKATKGQGSFRIEVEPIALRNLIQTLNLMDKETQQQVRDAATPLSKRLAGQIMQFGHASPTPQTNSPDQLSCRLAEFLPLHKPVQQRPEHRRLDRLL